MASLASSLGINSSSIQRSVKRFLSPDELALAAVDPASAAADATLSSLAPPQQPITAPDAELLQPKVMPTPDGEAARLAKRRSLAAQMQRRGRASTILTADDVLGG